MKKYFFGFFYFYLPFLGYFYFLCNGSDRVQWKSHRNVKFAQRRDSTRFHETKISRYQNFFGDFWRRDGDPWLKLHSPTRNSENRPHTVISQVN